MKLTQSITINAPVTKVFEVFTDLEHAEQNLSGIKKLEMIEGPTKMEVGTKWRETREMMGKDSTEEMWVSDLVENKSYSVDAESHGTKYRSTFTFDETSNGIEVSWIFESTPQSLFAKFMNLFAFMLTGTLKKMMKKDLEELKSVCER